eukprot:6129656-Amphidinium_carterae.2
MGAVAHAVVRLLQLHHMVFVRLHLDLQDFKQLFDLVVRNLEFSGQALHSGVLLLASNPPCKPQQATPRNKGCRPNWDVDPIA